MCVTIFRKEELTNDVFADFKDNLVVRGLRRMLNMLLEKCIDTLTTVPAVSNLHYMLMSSDMNAGSLRGILPLDVEDFCLAYCNTFGGLFADHAHKSRLGGHNAKEKERLFSGTIKFRVVDMRYDGRVEGNHN